VPWSVEEEFVSLKKESKSRRALIDLNARPSKVCRDVYPLQRMDNLAGFLASSEIFSRPQPDGGYGTPTDCARQIATTPA
jgi:hypothetical protein